MRRVVLSAVLILVAFISCIPVQPTVEGNRFQNEFLSRINKVRAKGCNCGTTYMPPAPPLTWNNQLENAAKSHAVDMARKKYFSHESKDGRTMNDRIMKAGYTYEGFSSYAIGENIAFGQQSIAEVSDGWFKSVGHCKNLMNRDFKEIGIAEVNHYWVQDFGGRNEFSPEQKKLMKNGAKLIMRQEKAGH
jgi:uncharacterized protein YkwD